MCFVFVFHLGNILVRPVYFLFSLL
jgi:hypothetical protein